MAALNLALSSSLLIPLQFQTSHLSLVAVVIFLPTLPPTPHGYLSVASHSTVLLAKLSTFFVLLYFGGTKQRQYNANSSPVSCTHQLSLSHSTHFIAEFKSVRDETKRFTMYCYSDAR